jgi:hypothetical protein
LFDDSEDEEEHGNEAESEQDAAAESSSNKHGDEAEISSNQQTQAVAQAGIALEDREPTEEHNASGGLQPWLESLSTSQEAAAAYPTSAETEGVVTGSAKRVPVVDDPLEILLSLDPPPQVIIVQLASSARQGDLLIKKIQETFPQAAIIGGVTMGSEIFTSSNQPLTKSAGHGVGILALQGNAPLFAMTCPFMRGRQASVQEVQRKLRLAEERAVSEEQKILGALLFTCNARGRQTFSQEANDARLFQATFPTAQLLGHYAGGEIGPDATEDESACFLRGNACLQGFTAVFGVFLVPRKQNPSVHFVRAVLHGQVREAFQAVCKSSQRSS